jgi:hypothetical protein
MFVKCEKKIEEKTAIKSIVKCEKEIMREKYLKIKMLKLRKS